jgi:hypothetical protein
VNTSANGDNVQCVIGGGGTNGTSANWINPLGTCTEPSENPYQPQQTFFISESALPNGLGQNLTADEVCAACVTLDPTGNVAALKNECTAQFIGTDANNQTCCVQKDSPLKISSKP